MDRGGQMIRSRLRGWRIPGSKPYSADHPPCFQTLVHAQSNVVGKTSSCCCGAADRRWAACPSDHGHDHGSKLRGPSQNDLSDASKRGVNELTKNIIFF
ncbi:hypothetical protein AVEN_73258-1 [Araneus ventricosus]|uniref:Uncharacterized protein n=1 Tax=Araneus ventricosus TaxID=182803 RepID=A0A4Y2F1R6_ARAVE|nr:hypothetical protein AVEN_73258-1 [Araneus ventricosus]